jgi:DNA modification methylase
VYSGLWEDADDLAGRDVDLSHVCAASEAVSTGSGGVSLPKPYYQDESCTIYHADCRDILPHLGPVDLVLTDPPYGVNYKPLRGSNGSKMWGSEKVKGDDKPFEPTFLLRFPKLILWGAHHYADALPRSGGWLVFDKCPNGPRNGFIYSHCELAWTNLLSRVQKFSLEWQGADRAGEDFLHPTQKPLALMAWCLTFSPYARTILDPFMGSGTTLRAAKDLGRKAIGIEIEEKYCEIAVKRLGQTVLPL